ncbi:SLC13 family permease [Halalkalicoccus salilacus]|uniref:SLC13 family permease n=1 Tax=Halalkalicoccus salilacus TaxID=3117459 RepID=UPI00300EAFA1
MTGATGRSDHRLGKFDPAWLSLPFGVTVASGVLLYAPIDTDMARMLAITVFCISLWIGTPVDPWFTGLIGIGLIGTVFTSELALVGFRSPATWLVVLGILLGEATRQSGLAAVIERLSFNILPSETGSDATVAYRYLLIVLSAVALGFVVLIPSSLVRVLILGPILISIGEVFTERRPRIGLFLGPLFVTYYAGTGILTGSLANIIIMGLVETNADVSVGWVEWAMWLGPVMSIGRAVVVTGIAYILYRPRDPGAIDAAVDTDSSPEAPATAYRMIAFLFLGVAIWATDTIHGLHPLYGALAVTLLAFAPQIGVVGSDAVGNADVSIVFFLGAIFAIAEGLQQTAFTNLAAEVILSNFPQNESLVVALLFLVVAALALTFIMEGLAVASVLTPVLVSFSESVGLPLTPVIMTEAIALNTYFFPYQSAVLVAILGLDVVDSIELIRMTALCSLVTLLVLLPIQILIFAAAF